jgi:hypothetical protein
MLTLIVPGLIWTRQALADLTFDLPLPAFTTLLGRGRLRHLPPADTTAHLAAAGGLATPLPAAALRRLALRGESGNDAWLCLDPVRLRFAERSMIVDDPRSLQLSAEESATLAASLAPTFAALGRIDVLSPDTWNLRLNADAPAFTPLSEAAGRSAAPLPGGPAYAPWRQALSEAQILLHEHPLNKAREAAGKPAVNSLWPWGGGRLPSPGAGRHDAFWSGDPVAAGVARLLGISHAELPAGFVASTARNPLAIHDAMEGPARGADAIAWRDALEAFEAGWLAPALAALRSGRLDGLCLLAPGELGSAELQVSRSDLWKFWRKPRALNELASL